MYCTIINKKRVCRSVYCIFLFIVIYFLVTYMCIIIFLLAVTVRFPRFAASYFVDNEQKRHGVVIGGVGSELVPRSHRLTIFFKFFFLAFRVGILITVQKYVVQIISEINYCHFFLPALIYRLITIKYFYLFFNCSEDTHVDRYRLFKLSFQNDKYNGSLMYF